MNQVILWKDMILFWGSNDQEITEHKHPSVQLVLAVKRSFTTKNQNGDWEDKQGLLIAPNYFHECNAKNIPILTVDIDPESILGEWVVKHHLKEKKVIDFNPNPIDFNIVSQKLENQDWNGLRGIVENIFSFQNNYEPFFKDDKIERVLNFIAQNIHETITTKKLAEVAFLSESRLLHLFKEKMGLPIRNYILWLRIRLVVNLLTKGHSLTDVAYQAGFSDQAHMSRTFKKVIGISPSTFSKNSKFIQVSFPT